jgi:hypothetical protein
MDRFRLCLAREIIASCPAQAGHPRLDFKNRKVADGRNNDEAINRVREGCASENGA